jgi:hypothetical protein
MTLIALLSAQGSLTAINKELTEIGSSSLIFKD